jgi:predicted DNA-binding protein
MTTSLRIRPELLSELKVLAVQRRCRVNDVVVEAIENLLELNGRRTAA